MEEAEKRRQQGDRSHQGHRDRRRRRDTETRHEAEADHEHAEQREHNRDASEYDRTTRRVERAHRRLERRPTLAGEFAVASDHEKHVVDADAETDHDADERGELGDRDRVREQADRPKPARADTGQSDTDREAHRHHRAERHDQDDHGERETDQLGLRRLELGEDRPTDLRRDAVDDGLEIADLLSDHGGAGLVDITGEVELGVGDPTIRGDLALAERLIRRHDRHAVDLIDRLEERRHLRHHRRVLNAVLGEEHQRATERAARPREVLVEHIETRRTLRLGGRELAGEAGPDRASQSIDADQSDDPGDEDEQAVLERPASEGSVHGGTFVSVGGNASRC